jgi:hypothetical protein
MAFQTLIVAVLVSGCVVYAAWSLMPGAAKRLLAKGLLRWPLPRAVHTRLQTLANAAGGCGCSGCDRAPLKTPAVVGQPLVFHPRKTL